MCAGAHVLRVACVLFVLPTGQGGYRQESEEGTWRVCVCVRECVRLCVYVYVCVCVCGVSVAHPFTVFAVTNQGGWEDTYVVKLI